MMPYLINGDISLVSSLNGDMNTLNTINGEMGTIIPYSTFPSYEGSTEITPTDEAQTLSTEGLLLWENITIKPIPSNYGKIEWNGSTLTVS